MFKRILLSAAVIAGFGYAAQLNAQSCNGSLSNVAIGGSSSGIALSATAAVTSNYNGAQISCALATQGNNSNGIITVTPLNGTSPYDSKISSDNGATYSTYALNAPYTGLPAGTYIFMVRDANGCEVTTAPVTITAPPAIVAGTCNVDADQCQLNQGELDVAASGGTGVLNITWSSSCTAPSGPGQGSPAGSAPGAPVPNTGTFPNTGGTVHYTGLTGNCNYSFVVTDANGCIAQ